MKRLTVAVLTATLLPALASAQGVAASPAAKAYLDTQLALKAPVNAPNFTASISTPILYLGTLGSVQGQETIRSGINDAYVNLTHDGTKTQIWSTYSSSAGAKPIVLAVGGTADPMLTVSDTKATFTQIVASPTEHTLTTWYFNAAAATGSCNCGSTASSSRAMPAPGWPWVPVTSSACRMEPYCCGSRSARAPPRRPSRRTASRSQRLAGARDRSSLQRGEGGPLARS